MTKVTEEKQEGLIEPRFVVGVFLLSVLMITLIINHIPFDVSTPLIIFGLILALGTSGQIRRLKRARERRRAKRRDEH